ncbi:MULTISPECIES: DJ-1 family glyoxalase III [unclassified Thioalkalivibrio]|uniref:DJ-1 family glyoxalase III n=1 Tax=unclassified Thioalkalivibrio TaxID=2621013 RepID=UPI00036D94D6|nr:MULTISPECIES: DJ-1 family glyoxalase III [unclassified Thioalkalivibrio]
MTEETPRVLVPLAAGAEELEAVTIIDLLRRARFEVTVAGLEQGPVRCSRGTVIQPDTMLDAIQDDAFDLIVLPGGLPGADHLRDDPRVQAMLRAQAERDGWLGAICAGPKALAQAGVLEGRRVTSFTGALDESGIPSTGGLVEVDGRIITGRGPGAAMDFALALIEQLAGREAREAVEGPLLRP